MQKTIYVTPFDASSLRPTQQSQPVPVATVEEAAAMFPGGRRVRQSDKLIILDLGAGPRMAVSDYRFA